MNEVFAKTRELGEALLASDEYKAVKQAEQKAMANKEAAETVGKFLELRSEMEELMRSNDKDWTKVQTLSSDMEELKTHMNQIDDLIALDKARETFSELINQINSVLHFIVTGEMNSGGNGCTGNCEGCGGCSAKVN